MHVHHKSVRRSHIDASVRAALKRRSAVLLSMMLALTSPAGAGQAELDIDEAIRLANAVDRPKSSSPPCFRI